MYQINKRNNKRYMNISIAAKTLKIKYCTSLPESKSFQKLEQRHASQHNKGQIWKKPKIKPSLRKSWMKIWKLCRIKKSQALGTSIQQIVRRSSLNNQWSKAKGSNTAREVVKWPVLLLTTYAVCYLLVWKAVLQIQNEIQKELFLPLLSTGLLPKWLQCPGLGQAEISSQELHLPLLCRLGSSHSSIGSYSTRILSESWGRSGSPGARADIHMECRHPSWQLRFLQHAGPSDLMLHTY